VGVSGDGGILLHHLLIAVALLASVGLDLIFVSFSDAAAAALVFAILSYGIMLLLSGSVIGYVQRGADFTTCLGPVLGQGLQGFIVRVLLAYCVPGILLLLVAFIPDMDDPLVPNATVQLGSTFAVFWLLMSLGLVGVVLGFLWPRTGPFQSVVVGGLVVLTQALLGWAKTDASRESLLIALYTWMVWVSICLIGAWLGLTLRQVSDFHLNRVGRDRQLEQPTLLGDTREE
jgi:hypothetical protein